MALKNRLLEVHRRLAETQRRGPLLALGRALLSVPAAAYRLAVALRNALYDRGWLSVGSASVPVISVGNISSGGTGKTPFVAWLAHFLSIYRCRPAVLSRGYGRDSRLGVDDENRMLGELIPGAAIVVEPDRLKGAVTAVEQFGCDVLILDDGFQHRRIARDLDIVLIDSLMPFAKGHLLPRGYLREPAASARRAGFVVLTRTDLAAPERLEELKGQLARLAPGVPVACCVHRPVGLRMVAGPGQEPSMEDLAGGRWAAFCGLGNPEGFRLTLAKMGVELGVVRVFPDHHSYTARELETLTAEADAAGCAGLLTTEKDAVKVARALQEPPPLPVLALGVEIDFTEGTELLYKSILRAIGRGGP